MPRKSVENNSYELLCAILCMFKDITCILELKDILTLECLNNSKIICKDIQKYITNLNSAINRNPKKVSEYIINFRKDINKIIFDKMIFDIDKLYLEGKTITSPEILDLNKNIDRKESKADIYIKLNNNNFIGISVKQMKNATLTNYSVQKMLPLEDNIRLTKIKRDFLTNKGFPNNIKTNRKRVNKLFYVSDPTILKDHIYWCELMKCIDINKTIIKQQLVENMLSKNLPYKLLEFNGDDLYSIEYNSDILNDINFEHYEPYYYCASGSNRNTAKLFYKLDILKKSYRVEVRWKGDIHTCSPQFCTHPI